MAEDKTTRAQSQSRPRRSRARRRRSAGARAAVAFLYVLLVIGLSALLATVGWGWANDLLALNKTGGTAVITIPESAITYTQATDKNGAPYTVSNADMSYVTEQLKKEGLIEYAFLFKLFGQFSHASQKIVAGTYELSTDMDYRALVANMGSSSATRQTVDVTIPEGYNLDQIFELLEEKGVSTVEKLRSMAAEHDYAFDWLQGIPLGDYHRLEGYLFPDTYDFYTGEDAKYVINKMLVNFDAKLTDTMREKIWAGGQNISQILTIASMIEKEATSTDRATISSVIYNRLNNPRAGTAGFLQIDATIQYLLPEGEKVDQEAIDTIDSPYNTYKYKGLPPGPIANPGLESILAAMNPESTNYYYYALGNDGQHHFFSSYSEFQNFLNS